MVNPAEFQHSYTVFHLYALGQLSINEYFQSPQMGEKKPFFSMQSTSPESSTSFEKSHYLDH